jgi:hypothetical protein
LMTSDRTARMRWLVVAGMPLFTAPPTNDVSSESGSIDDMNTILKQKRVVTTA